MDYPKIDLSFVRPALEELYPHFKNTGMKKALIKKVSKGKLKGQFRFVLKASNGETVAVSSPESYTQKHSAIETLQANFPDFEIVDRTKDESI